MRRHTTSFTLRNLPNKYPNLRTSFAHGGMLESPTTEEGFRALMGDQIFFEKLQDPRKTLGHKNLYFDTLVHDSHTLELLKNVLEPVK